MRLSIPTLLLSLSLACALPVLADTLPPSGRVTEPFALPDSAGTPGASTVSVDPKALLSEHRSADTRLFTVQVRLTGNPGFAQLSANLVVASPVVVDSVAGYCFQPATQMLLYLDGGPLGTNGTTVGPPVVIEPGSTANLLQGLPVPFNMVVPTLNSYPAYSFLPLTHVGMPTSQRLLLQVFVDQAYVPPASVGKPTPTCDMTVTLRALD